MSPTDVELLDLAKRVGTACRSLHLTLVTAESCTAGLVAHLVTEIPGSSDYFRGGIVSYADDVKESLAGVSTAVLRAHGAVSAQVALAMAEGARTSLRADVAVAVTGIAGPGGGSADKPVGLTYIALSDGHGGDVRRFIWTLDRSGNKLASAGAALTFVLDRLDAEPT
ncbi:MAG: CinA family protein [Candidatus Limnocylindrales bacterium]